MLQCGLALVNLTKILQGFITDTGQAWGCSSDNWVTLRQINSLRLSDTHMCQYNIWTLVQIMACRLFGAKPLSEPMLSYYQLDLKGHIPFKILTFSFSEMHFKMSLGKVVGTLPQPQCVNNLRTILKQTKTNHKKTMRNFHGISTCLSKMKHSSYFLPSTYSIFGSFEADGILSSFPMIIEGFTTF